MELTEMKQNTQCYLVGQEESKETTFSNQSIDLIDNEYRDSSLSLYDYYTFYGFVHGIYNDQYQTEMDGFIQRHCLDEYRDIPIACLDLVVQIVVRMFITIQKQAEVILLHDFNGSINEGEIASAMTKLKSHCIKSKKTCMIVRNNR